jgi:hypothetical protein
MTPNSATASIIGRARNSSTPLREDGSVTEDPQGRHRAAAYTQPHLEVVGRHAKERNQRSVGEETQPILRSAVPAAAAEVWDGRVEDVIDGNGPIPADLDPEAVWALRRIARALNWWR